MLTDVAIVDQKSLIELFRFTILSGQNTLILGPSGGGKTFMAQQVAKELDCHLIYINMSVLERTDFQGMPVISQDRETVSYATPDFLPFNDVKTKHEVKYFSALRSFTENVGFKAFLESGNVDVNDLRNKIDDRLDNISSFHDVKKMREHISFSTKIKEFGNFDKILNKYFTEIEAAELLEKPIMFLFDEVDKASHETLQTLLEFLQFHSVNGRKMNIKGCILTGNLPDEFANSSNISHAITKRCMTYKLELDFNQWREWAFLNDIHEYVIAFLTAHPDFLYKKAPDNDPTAYALPSPRTWSSASAGIKLLQMNDRYKNNDDLTRELMILIVAGNVGQIAAVKFNNWIKHFRDMDPIVHDLIENGKFPPTDKLDMGQVFICALSSCSKVYASLKPDNEATIKKYCKNTFKWLATLSEDIQMGSIRMAYGGDWDSIKNYNLADIPEFTEIFKTLKKIMVEPK